MPAGQLLTGDHNLVNVQAAIYYKMRPEQVADYVVQADRVDGLTARAAETVLAEWVASRTVDEALLNGKVGLRVALVEQVQERIQEYALGVEVLDAPVALIAPPDEVKSAFDDVAREQTRIAAKDKQRRTGSGKSVAHGIVRSIPHRTGDGRVCVQAGSCWRSATPRAF